MLNDAKILIVSGIYPPDIGGPATYIPQLCKQLYLDGYKVSLVSLEDKKDVRRVAEPWKRTFISRENKKPWRVILTLIALLKEASDCDVIFANGLYEEIGLLSLFHPKIRAVAKIVGDPIWERERNRNDSQVQIEEFNKNNLTFRNFVQRKFLKWSLNRFSVITSPSRQLAELVKSWDVKRDTLIIPNGVNCQNLSNAEFKYDVVSVTRLVRWKNLDKLIIACSKLKLSLVICGDGPEMKNLRQLSNLYDANVKFTGQLNATEVSKIVEESKIFALLSSYEGLSFALLEAMMTGKRILVSNCRGNMDVIEHNISGIIVDPNNEIELENGLAELAIDNRKSQKLSKNAYLVAKKDFCAEKQIRNMINLIVGTNESR